MVTEGWALISKEAFPCISYLAKKESAQRNNDEVVSIQAISKNQTASCFLSVFSPFLHPCSLLYSPYIRR